MCIHTSSLPPPPNTHTLSSLHTHTSDHTQPGVQVYTANWLNAQGEEPAGSPHVQHGAVCLETEHFPNHVASMVLRPGATYHHCTRHRFYTIA